MKVVSTDGLTKLIQLIKGSFISTNDTVNVSTVTLANVATTGEYSDLLNTPTIPVVTNMQTTTNMVDVITNVSTNTTYPTASAVYNIVGDIETLINAL